MKNLKISKKLATLALISLTSIPLTNCSSDTEMLDNNSQRKENESQTTKYKEGILVIGNDAYLIQYKSIVTALDNDKIYITLIDNTTLTTTYSNFYTIDKENSIEYQKIKEKVITEDHIIK